MADKDKKLKDIFKSYMRWPIIAGFFFAAINVGLYFLDIRSGLCMSFGVLIYLELQSQGNHI